MLEEKKIEVEGQQPNQYQKLEVLVTEGSLKDKTINIEVGDIAVVNQQKYQPDEEVIITYAKGINNEDVFYITDYVRHKSLVWLFVIFVVLTVIIGKRRGISSLFGMGLSFLVIFKYILPSILQGTDPISTAIIGSFFIIPITFYLSHGFNKKTTVAVVGTLIALVITGFLSKTYVEVAKLTGFASEEAGFLQVAKQGAMNMKGILLAGIIIGVLGVLDDITISQSAVVFQLKKTNPLIKKGELYKAAMNVGQDHIASM
ncbi:MAG: YibE/F family protein, partial [Candidatus Omnitrophica bacterium]|nr:YibE/F family protein [Candidatus Omnitrophota bacterium]